MKRKLALLLVAAMTVSTLAGCGSKTESGSDDGSSTENVDSTTTESTETLADLDTSLYITLGEYKGITVDIAKDEVTDEDVEDYIMKNLVAAYGDTQALTADDTVQEGDTVHYSCVGTVDGVAFEGGSTGEDELWDLEIGSGTTIEGFEDGFIGMKVGETKEINATFPDTYGEETLQGKAAIFTVNVDSADRTDYATELTQEIIEYYGYADEEECRADVRTTLEETAESDYRSNLESAVIAAVQAGSEFQTPPQFLIDIFVASQNEYYEYYASYFGMEFEDFINSYCGVTLDEYNAQIEEIAISYAQQYVMYEAIADAEGIDVSGEDLDAYAETTAADYGYDSIDALYEDFGKDDFRDYTVIQLVIEFLIDNCNNTSAPADTAVTDAAAEDVTAE